MRMLMAVGLLGWMVVAAPAKRLTVADCDRWIGALEGDTQAALADDEEAEEEETLLNPLREARRQGQKRDTAASTKQIAEFRKRTLALAKEGRLSGTERQRLLTLSDTAQRCLEQVDRDDPDAEDDEDEPDAE